jgi:hypothetical protein
MCPLCQGGFWLWNASGIQHGGTTGTFCYYGYRLWINKNKKNVSPGFKDRVCMGVMWGIVCIIHYSVTPRVVTPSYLTVEDLNVVKGLLCALRCQLTHGCLVENGAGLHGRRSPRMRRWPWSGASHSGYAWSLLEFAWFCLNLHGFAWSLHLWSCLEHAD